MVSNIDIILSFDLDNTLINNKKGIVNSFNYALMKYHQPQLERMKIEKMIGTPLNDMFAKVSHLDSNILSKAFREYYGSKGIFQSRLIPGAKKKLETLKKASFRLGIITSKKQEMAERIVEILKIDNYFDFIFGETESRKKLGKLDPILITILNDMYPKSRVIVIGDHPKDFLLSNNFNCPFIGVLTGHYSANELKKLKVGSFLAISSIKDLKIKNIYDILR